jgi:hypothetical protein
MVQHGGTPDFNRNEQEEEKVWKAQYEVGSQIRPPLTTPFSFTRRQISKSAM